MDAPKYRAFISYSHRDARWASWLHAALESYRPPKPLVGKITARGEVPKRLTPIFKDREELPSAMDLGGLVNAALEASACQIVICSPQLREVALGQRGDPCVQASRARGPDLHADRRPASRMPRICPGARRRNASPGAALQARRRRCAQQCAHRADRGRCAPRQGRQAPGGAQAGRRTPRGRLRYAPAARAATPQPPAVRVLVRGAGGHGGDQRPRRVRAGAA